MALSIGVIITVSKKNLNAVFCTVLLFFVLTYNNAAILSTALPEKTVDKVGIKEIYPTKVGGREWFLNSEDPRADGLFYITSDKNITRQDDGSWLINSSEVRFM
jgi:hypothetical protein